MPRRNFVLQLWYNGAILDICCRATEKFWAAVIIQQRDASQMLPCHRGIGAAVKIQRRDSWQMLPCHREILCCSYNTTARFLTDVAVPQRNFVLQLWYNGAILDRRCRATDKLCAAVMIQRRDSWQTLPCHREGLRCSYDTTARFLTDVVVPGTGFVLQLWYNGAILDRCCRALNKCCSAVMIQRHDSW